MAFELLVVLMLASGAQSGAPMAHHGHRAVTDTIAAARVTRTAFRQLRWVAGAWRGSAVAGTDTMPFFERYDFPDDSTFVVQSYAEEGLKTVTGTVTYALRHGILGKVDTRWVATRVGRRAVTFSSGEPDHVTYTWRSETPRRWTVELAWVTPDGKARRLRFQMNRLPKT